MKYMKLGTKPDLFYTEAAVRTVLSDVPTDLIINVNNTKYLLHKFPLILKCGLIQRLCSDTDEESGHQPIALHDIPGGEEAFELCAKFCYGITMNLSAFNFVPANLAAKYLQMTESVTKNNFISKLELFFNSCILQGWKDAIVMLQSMWKLSGWPSDDPRIVQPCKDSIIEKILVHPAQVTWSYTYTRPGYDRKQQRSIPKDWWTEDVSDLDLDLFRSIISTVRSTRKLPPALIGEVLHVYVCKHLPNPKDMQYPAQSSSARTDDTLIKHRRVLESIVSMIPKEPRSVSGGFLLKLLKIANYVGASSSTKAELIRRSSRQLDEVNSNDLLIPLVSNPEHYDIGAVQALLENFLEQFRKTPEGAGRMIRSLINVGKTLDSYLKIIAQKADLPVSKFIDVAESLPEMAREEHDTLYQAIDTYLKEHPELSKGDRKRLCRMIDCRKLSPDARANAIANDRLPLRTVVQLLFVEQERAGGAGGSHEGPFNQKSSHVSDARVTNNEQRKAIQQVENQHRTPPGSGEKEENKRIGRTISESKKTKEETWRTVRN